MLASDFHLEPGDSCTEDTGATNLRYEGEPWEDCAEFGDNGYEADLGAYGGPFAYIDKNLNGIPDCSEPKGWSSGVAVLKNSTNQPVTLAARNMEAGDLTYSVTVPTVHGDLAGAAPHLSYTVTPEFAGADGLSFTVANSVGLSAPAQVNITVKESNIPPTATEQFLTISSAASMTITLQGSDADGDPLSFSVVSEPLSGALVCLHPPECLYFADNMHGEVEFSYRAHDGIQEGEPATVTVLVVDVTPPTISPSPPGGAYRTEQVVTLEADEPATIHCTIDGSAPTISSPICSGPITVIDYLYLRWIAIDTVGNQSSGATTYTIDDIAPEVWCSPAGGSYRTEQTVTLEGETTLVFYTTDGSQPTISSPRYTAPIAVNDSLLLRWIAIDAALNQSEGTATYIIDRIAPEVTSHSPAGGLYRTVQSVTFQTSEPATVYCTSDGTVPTTSSPDCTESVLVGHSLTLHWLARDAAGHESVVGADSYEIDMVPPEVGIDPLPDSMKLAASLVVTGTREAGVPVTLTANRPVDIGPIAKPSPTTWSGVISNLQLGSVTFTATATDPAGNMKSAVATTEIYDQPPSITSSYPNGAALDLPVDSSAHFWVIASDPDDAVLSLTWTLDGQVIGSGSSLDFNPDPQLADGIPKALTLTASDGFLSAARTWQVTVHQVDLIDDDACSYTGSWSVYASASGYLGKAYHRSSGADAGAATCSVALDSAGTYKVYARWPAASTHDSSAVYRVTLLDGKFDDILVDQTTNGGQWNLLGTYVFGTTASVTLLSTAGDMAVADGIRLVATADPPDIVMDDADEAPATVTVGAWDSFSGAGFRGAYHTAPGDEGNNSFTWNPQGVAAGTWDLFARWRGLTGGATDAKYFVSFDGMRSSQVTADQTVLGGRWNLLGTFSFESSDTPSVYVTDNANGTVVADGVKLAYRGAGSITIVDNDGDSDFDPNADGVPDRFGWNGYWTASNGVAGFVGTSYRRIDAGSGGWAKWLLNIPEDGNYEVFARWTEATDRSSSVRYELRRKGVAGTTAMIVDQKVSGGQWEYLGRFAFEKDDDPEQAPADHETHLQVSQSADGVVVADAVLFARTDEDLPLIVDNVADNDLRTEFTKSSGWVLPAPLLPGHSGSNYFQTGYGGKTAIWEADLLTAGNYDIFARWTADTDRTASASYLVSGATAPVVKDQHINGGAWVSLGRYYQPEGWASVQLTSGTGVTVADAVRFDYTTLPLSIVLDNTEDALPPHACSTVGGWPSNTTFTDAWNGEYQTHAKDGTGTFRWTPTVPLRGYYAVYARWPTANSLFSTAAPFRIVYGLAQDQQVDTRNMNLQTNGDKWNYLGTYLFEAGDSGFVELSGVADGKVLADAVKFIAEGH